MKVLIQVPKTDFDTAFVTIENQNFKVRAIAPLCRVAPVYAVDSTDATKVNIYVNIDKVIQGGGYSTDTAATQFIVLSNEKNDVYNNFQNITISKFMKGITYLVPAGALGVLPMIPNIEMMPVAGITNGTDLDYLNVVTATHYRFDCTEDTDIMNATNISGAIAVEMDGKLRIQLNNEKMAKKAIEVAEFASATGVK